MCLSPSPPDCDRHLRRVSTTPASTTISTRRTWSRSRRSTRARSARWTRTGKSLSAVRHPVASRRSADRPSCIASRHPGQGPELAFLHARSRRVLRSWTRAPSGASRAFRCTPRRRMPTERVPRGTRAAVSRVAPVRRLQSPLHDRSRGDRADDGQGLGRRRGRRCASRKARSDAAQRSVAAVAALAFVAQAPAPSTSTTSPGARPRSRRSRTRRPARELPKALKDLCVRPVPRHPLQAGDGRSGATPNLPFEVQLFHPGLYYDQPVRISESRRRRGARDPLRSRALRLRQEQARPGGGCANSASRAFACTFALNNAEVQGRGAGVPGRELLPRARQGSALRAFGARSRDRHRRSRRARNSRASSSSGSSVRTRTRRSSRSTRCSTRSASPARIASCCAPARRRSRVVKARLFLRENVTKLGIAPLTSMFFFGENQLRTRHATTGPRCTTPTCCSIQAGTGEWITRPLVNPKRLLVTSFALTNPLGFGLMQRDRSFDNYQDLEARYELRPSAWVEPRGHLGHGPRRAGADSHARRDQRQHRRVLGARRRCRRRASRSTSSIACAGRRTTRRGRRSRGSRRRGAATATRKTPDPSDRLRRSTSKARRSRNCPPTRRSKAWSPSTPTASSSRTTRTATTSPAAGACACA